jgi:hypothetical protein
MYSLKLTCTLQKEQYFDVIIFWYDSWKYFVYTIVYHKTNFSCLKVFLYLTPDFTSIFIVIYFADKYMTWQNICMYAQCVLAI